MSDRSADPSRERPHVVIIGAMGVGKTTAATALAERLGWSLRDSDADIRARTGRSGKEIAVGDGVPALHELEAAVLLDALAGDEPTVIAAAASTVERADVRRALRRRATVIRLLADTDVILRRQAAGGHRRPMEAAELEALSARREPLLAEVEDSCVDAGAAPDEVVRRIEAFLESNP